MTKGIDFLVIGGGLYGIKTAIFLAGNYPQHKIVLAEKESSLFTKASLYNQLRIHNGWHYLGNPDTLQLCKKWYTRFVEEYGDCLVPKFKQVYRLMSEGLESTVEAHFRPNEYQRLNQQDYKVEESCLDIFLFRNKITNSLKQYPNIRVALGVDGETFKKQARTVIYAVYEHTNDFSTVAGFSKKLCTMQENDSPTELSPNPHGNTCIDGCYPSLMPSCYGGKYLLTHSKFSHLDLQDLSISQQIELIWSHSTPHIPELLRLKSPSFKTIYSPKFFMTDAKARPVKAIVAKSGEIFVVGSKLSAFYELEGLLKELIF